MEPSVSAIKENGVAVITLNRPKVYNAVDEEMLNLLAGQLCDLSYDKGTCAVVITGEGKVFCSGGDLRSIHDFPKGAPQGVYELATLFHRFYHEHRIVTDDDEMSNARLYLVKATRQVLSNVLILSGVAAPSSM